MLHGFPPPKNVLHFVHIHNVIIWYFTPDVNAPDSAFRAYFITYCAKKAPKLKGGTNIEDLQFIIEEDPFEKGSLLKLLP